jgi:hypothetical protein
MAGPSLRGRRLLVLALLLGLGLAGAVGFQVWRRRQPIRPFATLATLSSDMGFHLAFLDESMLVAVGREGGVLGERVYSISHGTAALVSEGSCSMPSEAFPELSRGGLALSLGPEYRALHVRTLPSLREVSVIPLDPELRATRAFDGDERVVALAHASSPETLVEVHRIRDGSLLGKLERKDLTGPEKEGEVAYEGLFFDRAGTTLHVVLDGWWLEWSLAEKRLTRVQGLPRLDRKSPIGLSRAGELLLDTDDGILACPPDGRGNPRWIVRDLGIERDGLSRADVLVSPTGERIVVRGADPPGFGYVIDVTTSRRFRLAPAQGRSCRAGAFSPSGEVLALPYAKTREQDVIWTIELFDLPP